jgi:hypothetical protein
MLALAAPGRLTGFAAFKENSSSLLRMGAARMNWR